MAVEKHRNLFFTECHAKQKWFPKMTKKHWPFVLSRVRGQVTSVLPQGLTI
jgi:hypothetical protein